MYGPVDFLLLSAAVVLRDDNGRAAGKAYEEADQEVDNGSGSTAYGGKRLFADKVAYNHGVGSVVELLEKGSEQDREEKDQQLFPDDALCDLVGFGLSFCSHK